jgi:hypothetical protein
MFRLKIILFAIALMAVPSCTRNQSTQAANSGERATSSPAPKTSTPADAVKSTTEPGALKPGEASGTYTAKGETVTLKYAYAGRAQRFGEDSVVLLLTENEIPADALADELKNQTMLLDGKIRGLEYAFMKDGYWVRYHPGQYQESKGPKLKDYVVENDVVKGSDEDTGDFTDGKYSRSVKFAAAISK